MRARRPQRGLAGAVGDRGLQAAAPLAQRGALQEDIRNKHRLQEHCVKDSERTQAVTARERGPAPAPSRRAPVPPLAHGPPAPAAALRQPAPLRRRHGADRQRGPADVLRRAGSLPGRVQSGRAVSGPQRLPAAAGLPAPPPPPLGPVPARRQRRRALPLPRGLLQHAHAAPTAPRPLAPHTPVTVRLSAPRADPPS